jgi:23S rRNA pseudouridine1911/1915/1917 synthase
VQRGFGRHSRKAARQAILSGAVRLNGRVVKIIARTVKLGDKLAVSAEATRQPTEQRSPEVRVVFSDRHLLVVDKPAKLLSERVPGEKGMSIQDALAPRFGQTFLVHRLDAGTSGVMMLARDAESADALNDAFRQAQVEKAYLLLCEGEPQAGEFSGPLGRDTAHARRFTVRPDGKHARTRYKTLAAHQGLALCSARPETGRTHQIRVHFQHGGHPLLGDRLYGGRTKVGDRLVHRPMLHAFALSFAHPKTRLPLRFVVAPPADFRDLSEALGLTTDFDATDPLW